MSNNTPPRPQASNSDLSMKPTRDDLASRPGNRGTRQPNSRNTRPPQNSGGGGTGLLWFFLLSLAAAVAGAGWYGWQELDTLRSQLAKSQDKLTLSQKNLGALQENLSQKSTVEGGELMRLRSGQQESEAAVSKLQAVITKVQLGNSQHEQVAKEFGEQLKQQQDKIAGLQENLQALSKSVESNLKASEGKEFVDGDALNKALNDALQKVNTDLQEIQNQAEATKTLLDKQSADIRKLEGASDAADKGVPDNLSVTLKEINERLEAIDAHRKQVNTRMDKQRKDLDDIYSKLPQPQQ